MIPEPLKKLTFATVLAFLLTACAGPNARPGDPLEPVNRAVFGFNETVDEAVLQLEMSNRQFVVFLNARTEKINVLHRRKDGAFGLMEPTFA